MKKRKPDPGYEQHRAESDERLLRMYKELGIKNLPPLPIGVDRTSGAYKAFRAEVDERLRPAYERRMRRQAD